VAADRDDEAQGFNGDSAEDKSGSRGRGRKKYERSDRQEKTGRHYQQPGIFHSSSLSGIRPMEDRPPDPGFRRGPQCLWFVTDSNRLERLYEF
jgi:hypothetical protein